MVLAIDLCYLVTEFGGR